jgi:hypothetical protein
MFQPSESISSQRTHAPESSIWLLAKCDRRKRTVRLTYSKLRLADSDSKILFLNEEEAFRAQDQVGRISGAEANPRFH